MNSDNSNVTNDYDINNINNKNYFHGDNSNKKGNF